MTLSELKRSVLALGFETELQSDEVLYSALNRALRTVYTDRPSVRSTSVAVPMAHGRLLSRELSHTPGACESFTLLGTGYSFRVSGKGSYQLTRGTYTELREFDTDMATISGRITPPTVISFLGECPFLILSLGDITAVSNDGSGALPLLGEGYTVNLAERLGDYMAPAGAPHTRGGKPIPGAAVMGDMLSFPESFFGEAVLDYFRCPTPPSGISGEEYIDIPRESEELLPLLVGAYVWLDDEPERAQLFLSLYKDGIAAVKRNIPRGAGNTVLSNGWA